MCQLYIIMYAWEVEHWRMVEWFVRSDMVISDEQIFQFPDIIIDVDLYFRFFCYLCVGMIVFVTSFSICLKFCVLKLWSECEVLALFFLDELFIILVYYNDREIVVNGHLFDSW